MLREGRQHFRAMEKSNINSFKWRPFYIVLAEHPFIRSHQIKYLGIRRKWDYFQCISRIYSMPSNVCEYDERKLGNRKQILRIYRISVIQCTILVLLGLQFLANYRGFSVSNMANNLHQFVLVISIYQFYTESPFQEVVMIKQ